MSLLTEVDGTYTREELERMTWPAAFYGTTPAEEVKRQEDERNVLVREAIGEIDVAYTYAEDDDAQYGARFERGELVEIVRL